VKGVPTRKASDPSRRDLRHPRLTDADGVGTPLAEQDDEWQVSDRRYFSMGSTAKVDALEGGEDTKDLLAQIA